VGDERYKRDKAYGKRPKGWDKDRGFPHRTCPASRHTAMIADSLRDPKSPMRRLLIDAGYEPDHMASSIESTCMSVWSARRYLKWDQKTGEWVPNTAAPISCPA